MENLKVSMLGITCAGKTTQATRLEDAYGVPRVTVGELLRDNPGVPLGPEKELLTDPRGDVYTDAEALDADRYAQTVGDVYDRGESFPIDTLMYVLAPVVERHDGYVLDGFPRVTADSRYGDIEFDAVIYLDVSEETARARQERRGRSDDSPELFETKVAWQRGGAEKVMDHYEDRDAVIHVVDGEQSRDEVFRDIRRKLGPVQEVEA